MKILLARVINGIEQKEKDIILNMVKKDMSIDIISEIVNLLADKVKEIISNNK